MNGIQRITRRKLSQKMVAIYQWLSLFVKYRRLRRDTPPHAQHSCRRSCRHRTAIDFVSPSMQLRPILRQFQNHFQSEFHTQRYLVLLLSINSILSVPQGHPVVTYVFFLVFPSLPSFPLSFVQLSCIRRQSLRKI